MNLLMTGCTATANDKFPGHPEPDDHPVGTLGGPHK